MKEQVKVSVPGKLMLFGEHAVVYHYPCIVTAVDQRMQIIVKPIEKKKFILHAPEVGLEDYSKGLRDLTRGRTAKGARFIETGIKNFFQKFKLRQGLRVKTKAGFSAEFGFGSSAAVTVGIIVGLARLFKIKLLKKQVFELAYKTILDVQGVGSGFDLAAAIWGGTIYFVTGGQKISPMRIKSLPLVVGYTGIKADTPTVVKKVAVLKQNNQKLVGSLLAQISLLTNQARKSLLQGDFRKTGELMNLNQGMLDALGVNTKELASLIFAAREAGAWGAKLSGAGGGDCMIALVPKEKRLKVEKAIKKAGGKVIKVEPNAEKAKLETN
ncbi:hypothetical protein AMJ51_02340 [Microgenomates bacterium DG_75]|nr:MAG: hypothetical protein AMJ51_02340 [Microgenomates bacterium DG_75]